MRRILVTSAGGAPGVNFARSLRDAPQPFHLIGVDANKYTLQRAEVDERFLIPRCGDPHYLSVLQDIIRQTRPELLHCPMSAEMMAVSTLRDQLGVQTFLPAHRSIVICEDKYKSYQCWAQEGLPVPKTLIVKNAGDLSAAFDQFGPRIWLRKTRGSAGKGSLPASDLETARRWIDFNEGWGTFTAAECLEPRTVTWQSIWHKGELVVAQGRRRLYWEFANRSPSGVTGITGTGVTLSDSALDALAKKAILAVDAAPHGIFGVDLTCDRDENLRITEINIGRFFTTHHFFTAAGLNMPHIYVQLAFGETPKLPRRRVNPLPSGMAWIRGMDSRPILKPLRDIDAFETELKKRIAKLSLK